jgi:hypothetical protein
MPFFSINAILFLIYVYHYFDLCVENMNALKFNEFDGDDKGGSVRKFHS